ncbi:putative CDP-alcohol phosphatidyltransferase class-I family protein 3 [Triticum urartu]|uniref:Putative CDP-alcohol phosphatidyltransferase class-I family protein 3 n=1 Tax=Triticum urartu TaxID=4572 RepID=M7ZVJ5_TRIUA|nr:putative CDP-alcohol phosphatidyltransferase class-I family protein 3 [Triticum urartu]
MGYVGSHGVATLRKYKYSGVDHSIVAKYILQPFWSRFVNVFPLWFPPRHELCPRVCVCDLECALCFNEEPSLAETLFSLGSILQAPGADNAKAVLSDEPWLLLSDSGVANEALVRVTHSKHMIFNEGFCCGGFVVICESKTHHACLYTYYNEGLAATNLLSFVSVEIIRRPNMITLTGFMFLLTSALLGFLYSPHLDTAPPRWVHLAHGILLFLYQTFDAVDGKQARRTNSSSPLGELFDHGCDALACAFESLAFGSTAMCGNATFWFWVISAVPFYFATWEHYFTNTLVLPIVNGPTEGLMLIYVCHIVTFFTGAEWWAQDFRKSVPLLNWVPLVPEISLYGIVLFLMIAFAVIPTIGSKSYLSPSDIMRNQPHLLIIGTGFAFGYLVGRMILAHLCDEPKGLKTGMCMALAYFPFAIANALTARLDDGNPLFDEQLVLLIYCLFTVALYMHFATSVIHEITNALGIHCFRITRKKA